MSARLSMPSRRLLGRYEIVAEIAKGGMGTVYLARLEGVGGFQRLVAIKLMHRHLAGEGQFASMLLDEARLASQLHHPNAVGVVDVAESDLGLYIVMEYVDGFALDDVLHKLSDESPEQRIRIGLRIWLDAVRGLSAAHALKDDEGSPLNIVHRDVSPQNILVGQDGAGRITDFGVARAAARITSSSPGMIKGKPCYMAPEQARGLAELDARADIFALGIVLYEVLAGEMLFQSDGGAAVTLYKVCNDELPPPSKACAEAAPLDEVCIKALERDLDARYQKGRALSEAVESAARAAGLLASRDEVADYLRDAFAKEIKTRSHAIKDHLSAIGAASSKPMQQSDIYEVPSLKERNRERRSEETSAERPAQKSGPWQETPEPRASAMESAATEFATSPTGVPPAGMPYRRLAIALGALGIVMIAAAAFMWSRSPGESIAPTSAPAEPPAEVSPLQPAATEPAATEPAATEPAATELSATEPAATEPAADNAQTDEPAATEPPAADNAQAGDETAADPEADATMRAEASDRPRMASMRRMPEPEPEPAVMRTDEAPTMGMQPGYESNPYIR